jgi:hypothetical protein
LAQSRRRHARGILLVCCSVHPTEGRLLLAPHRQRLQADWRDRETNRQPRVVTPAQLDLYGHRSVTDPLNPKLIVARRKARETIGADVRRGGYARQRSKRGGVRGGRGQYGGHGWKQDDTGTAQRVKRLCVDDLSGDRASRRLYADVSLGVCHRRIGS